MKSFPDILREKRLRKQQDSLPLDDDSTETSDVIAPRRRPLKRSLSPLREKKAAETDEEVQRPKSALEARKAKADDSAHAPPPRRKLKRNVWSTRDDIGMTSSSSAVPTRRIHRGITSRSTPQNMSDLDRTSASADVTVDIFETEAPAARATSRVPASKPNVSSKSLEISPKPKVLFGKAVQSSDWQRPQFGRKPLAAPAPPKPLEKPKMLFGKPLNPNGQVECSSTVASVPPLRTTGGNNSVTSHLVGRSPLLRSSEQSLEVSLTPISVRKADTRSHVEAAAASQSPRTSPKQHHSLCMTSSTLLSISRMNFHDLLLILLFLLTAGSSTSVQHSSSVPLHAASTTSSARYVATPPSIRLLVLLHARFRMFSVQARLRQSPPVKRLVIFHQTS